MALVVLNLRPTDTQLRQFGATALVMLSVIGGVFWGLHRIELPAAAACAAAGMTLFVMSRLRAGLIRPVWQGLMLLTFPIGWAVSHAAMAVFFYGLLTPLAMILRLAGRDPLTLSYDRQAPTYWKPYTQKRSAKDYFHQF